VFREKQTAYYERRDMLTVTTSELDLMEVWQESDPEHKRVQCTFPINRWAGARDTAVVYFELQPGDRLPTHTDSAEEVLYIVAGQAEAEVGDERARVRAGDLAVIPAMVPHGLVNDGEEPVRVVGFFCEPEIISTFEEPLQPVGQAELNQGAPVPT
jgi:quercetin dioxygenase-like cupin family protein